MPSISIRSLAFSVGSAEVILYPAGIALFAAVAVGFDLTFLQSVLSHASIVVLQGATVVVMLVLVFTTLVHEIGHALAFRLQGARNIRITLCATGGSCTASIEHDTSLQVLARALAGPAATVIGIGMLFVVWSVCPIPFLWRVAVVAAIIFATAVEVFNIFPLHSRSDGTVALYALIWLIYNKEPEQFDVLYIWRPLALTAIVLVISIYNFIANFIPVNRIMIISMAITVLLLLTLPLLVFARRCLYGCDDGGN